MNKFKLKFGNFQIEAQGASERVALTVIIVQAVVTFTLAALGTVG